MRLLQHLSTTYTLSIYIYIYNPKHLLRLCSASNTDGASIHYNFVRQRCSFAIKTQDKTTYPEVVSRSMPRTLKDFCERACSQQGPPRKKLQTAQVCSLRTVRIFFVRFYGFCPVHEICYRHSSAVSVPSAFSVFNPPPPPVPQKFQRTPADNARLRLDGGLCRPSCCNPFVDQVLGSKTHKGVKQKIVAMDSGPVLIRGYFEILRFLKAVLENILENKAKLNLLRLLLTSEGTFSLVRLFLKDSLE